MLGTWLLIICLSTHHLFVVVREFHWGTVWRESD